ncbi:uncharacterized protein LOC130772936 [Actinidia eriantha]|uniref:uncharacterized protein LOC130772936 n=1 Tax=Actinidia eriantha TaxID=165200 RepID=UPI0025838347|nr:uncharacterized protein LOC130772936 [Actinidia eriantha]
MGIDALHRFIDLNLGRWTGSFRDNANRLIPFVGKWKGHSITKRSGVYGATIAEADTIVVLEIDDEDQLIQDITSTSSGGDVITNVQWTDTLSNNLIKFNGGFQVTLLPGGMYMGCPSHTAKHVAESNPFHLEFCWLESPRKRQRLVCTYDVEGLVVSSTYFYATKLRVTPVPCCTFALLVFVGTYAMYWS